MTRIHFALVIMLVAIPLSGIGEVAEAQSSNRLGPGNLNCTDFVPIAEGGLDHADAVMAATEEFNGTNFYQLDGNNNGFACDGETTPIGDGAADCSSFTSVDNFGQEHAQALYEAAGPGVYDLDVVDGVACYSSLQQSPSAPTPAPAPAPSTSSRSCPSGIVAEVSHAIVCSGGGGSGYADTLEDDDLVFVAKADGGSGISSDIGDVASDIGVTPSGNTFSPAIGIFQTQATQQAADDVPRQMTTEQKARKLKAKRKRFRKARRARLRAAERERQAQEHRGGLR